MSFRVEIEITPDADGAHCGECGTSWDRPCLFPIEDDTTCEDDDHWVRCPACLAAEKAWREKQQKADDERCACGHWDRDHIEEGCLCCECRDYRPRKERRES